MNFIMANPTISQIKIGNTTYDICDYTARENYLGIITVECTVNSNKSINSNSYLWVYWDNKDPDITGLTYFGYTFYELGHQALYVAHFIETGINVCNRRTTGSDPVVVKPIARQMYMSLDLS